MNVEIIGASLFEDFGGEAQPTEPVLTVKVALKEGTVTLMTEYFRFTTADLKGMDDAAQQSHVLGAVTAWASDMLGEAVGFGDYKKLIGRKVAVAARPQT